MTVAFHFLFVLLVSLPGCKDIRTRPADLSEPKQNTMKTIYDIPLTTIDGEPATLAPYKGKKMLLVNVASECGFTKQYVELQGLSDTHGDKVTVLGFPANNFGGQEPGTDEQIKDFCSKNFGVTFPRVSRLPEKDTQPTR